MSRKLFVTICLSMALITGAAATEVGATADLGDVMPVVAGQIGWPEIVDPGTASVADPAWLVLYATDPDADPHFARPRGVGFATHRAFDLGGLDGGAAAAFDFDFESDGYAEPVHRRDWPDSWGLPGDAFNASLGGAVGLRLGDVQAGPFSSLTYSRFTSLGDTGMGARATVDQSVTGSVGVQASTRFDSGLGPMESHLRLSLDHDFLVDRQSAGSTLDPWRRNIYVEEVDASRFDLDNAIVFLKHRGRIPGWFFYETRIRVRTTGIKSVSGRIWVKW